MTDLGIQLEGCGKLKTKVMFAIYQRRKLGPLRIRNTGIFLTIPKLRGVCNVACRFCGTSLNDVLLPGPNVLCDLIGISITFRFFPMCGDIEAMFMQVEVPGYEQNCLKFLRREGHCDEIEVFQ